MTLIFTRGADSFSPWDRIGFEVEQDNPTRVRRLLDGTVDYVIAGDGPREGTWDLFFLTAAEAEAARALLEQPGPWVVTDDIPAVSMTVLRKGRMSQVQQDNRARWMLRVGLVEVLS